MRKGKRKEEKWLIRKERGKRKEERGKRKEEQEKLKMNESELFEGPAIIKREKFSQEDLCDLCCSQL